MARRKKESKQKKSNKNQTKIKQKNQAKKHVHLFYQCCLQKKIDYQFLFVAVVVVVVDLMFVP